MSRHFSSAIAAAVALVLLMPLAGCAGRGKHTRADTQYVARDVNTLYILARQRLDSGNYASAAAIFDEVERQHPYSVWARRAQLMSAFSYYAAKDYTKAIDSSRRFLAIHPGNRDASYAYYLVAISYYEQVNDVERDQATTKQALDTLGELIRRYPDTEYAADARLKIDLVRDHLAGKEMEVGRFYQHRGEWLAATIRFRTVVDQYQTTSHVPEALERLTECYLSLGIPIEARKAAAVLGHNYPGSKWYQRAYALTERHPPGAVAAAEPVPASPVAAAPPPAPAPAETSAPPPAATPAPAPAQPTPAPAQTAPTQPAPADATAQPHA